MTLTASGSIIIRNNSAYLGGGGIYADAVLTLGNVTISDNKAGYSSGSFVTANDGGGIYANNALTLTGPVTIQNNNAGRHGGGIFKNTTGSFLATGLTLFNLTGNGAGNFSSAGSGGGIYTTVPFSLNNSNKPTISSNTASTNGGAIASGNTSADLTLDSLSIVNNRAANQGGGVYVPAALMSRALTFSGNTAKDGGGIYATGNATIINNTFSGNTVTGNGGAINATGTTGITLSTFNRNTALGGQAIFFNNVTGKTLNGNIIYGNGTGVEINLLSGIQGAYNIIRGTVLPFSDNVTNKLVAASKGDSIFAAPVVSDLAVLGNNGGPTQTINIVKNGFAYNFIPPSQVAAWGSIPSDQRGSLRTYSCKTDAGSVELQVQEDILTYALKPLTVCPNTLVNADTLILSRVNVKSIAYYTDNTYTILQPMPVTITAASNKIYVKFTSTSNCESNQVITVGVFPKETTWINTAGNDNWNEATNWDNGIPGPCTNVIIPSGKIAYPILQPAGSSYTQAACDTITFKFGGEVAKTNYLQYNFAKADLTLSKSRWYMLSPILQQQYSGDYQEDGSKYRINPEISIMYYQTGNPETGATKVNSKFTGLFNNTDELLKLSTGHALWVDEGNRPESAFTLHFPKDSTQYSYYSTLDNHVTRVSGTMARDKRGRFIYEGNGSYQASSGNFSQTIENSNDYPQLIIGNPYLSHFDVVEFQRQNSAYLSTSFRIWKGGTSYETYLINGDGTITGTDPDFRVSPMQSVIIDTEQRFTNPLLFTPAMSITSPGQILRSSSDNASPSNMIRIEILREGVRQSGMVLAYKAGAGRHYDKRKDVWTMIPQSVGSYVSLYALVDGGAASIYTTGDLTTPIDLGVSVGTTISKSITGGKAETYTIRMSSGMESFLAGKEVYLLDLSNNTTHQLTESGYDFRNTTGNVSGRFQLFVKEKISTGIIDPSTENQIRVIQTNGGLSINSSAGDLIREVAVYGMLGQQIYKITGLNVSNWTFNLPVFNQVVIIKVKTERSSKTEKIILK